MAENLQLLSRERENSLRLADEERKLLDEQRRWADLTDEYHQQIRLAAEHIGRKAIAQKMGRDLSTVSNQLSCEAGRGYPTPAMMLVLRDGCPDLKAWEEEHAHSCIDDAQVITQIERDLLPDLGKREAQLLLSILRRRRAR